MTSSFILVITITFGLGSDQQTFQMSFPKETQAECLSDAEKFKVPLPFISIQTKCEPTLAPSPNEDEKTLNT